MQIKKIQIMKDERIQVKWTVFSGEDGQDVFENEIKCPDAPKESFDVAIQNLKTHALELCELPQGEIGRIAVTGMEIQRKGDHQVIGASLLLTRSLKKSSTKLSFSTPLKYVDKVTDGPDKGDVFSKEAAKAVKTMIKEAEKYVEGKRLQTNAFDNNQPEGE